ncbi:MAG: hypothetical protein WCQ54_11465 [Clostridiaceae bacterium]
MKKKNITVILIIIAASALFYIMQPKKGSFNDLILSQYQGKNFTQVQINYIPTDSDLAEFTCKDKNKINEFISYLETLKLVEANGSIYYGKSTNYYIFIRNEVKNSEGQLHANENLGITVYGNNLNIIDIFNNNHTKTYKIVNGKFDMKYIREIMKKS